MSDWSWVVPLPVVVPLVGAGLAVVAGRRERWQRIVSLASLGFTMAAAAGLLAAAHLLDQPLVVSVGGWVPPQGIVLVADRITALMLLIASLTTLGVTLYAIGQGRDSHEHGDGESPLPVFHPALLILIAGVDTSFLSGDLFHIYVGFEMLLVASFVLLTLGGTPDRVRAGVNYVFVSLLSSMLFLTAIAMIYAACGTVNLAQLAVRLAQLPESHRVLLQVLLLVGFAVKAAIFPMSGWLPDSYPTAPAPVTAVFAGLLTKVGVYAIIRTQTLLFPGGGFVPDLLMWAALATMLVAIIGAIAQDDAKRLLSFTLVSHIGYMVYGVAVGNQLGLSSAIFYVAHHIVVQTALFLVIGLVEAHAGSTSLARLGGVAGTAPLVAILFFVPAMNLAGIPPLSGFLGKVGLLQAGVAAGSPLAYTLVAGSLVTSLLTLYAVSRVWSRAFWRSPGGDAVSDAESDTALQTRPSHVVPADPATAARIAADPAAADPLVAGPVTAARRTVPRGLLWPAVLLVVVSTALTLAAGPLYAVTDAAAREATARAPYISAVFPGGVP
ncbi:MAG: Na+/H+ antiporter subunit D [Actinobacteria bacterium]|nr:Na+/H+ antiporter subunit D [Actinomycetota bacterium]